MDRIDGVEAFRTAMLSELPDAFIEVDAPEHPTGSWWLEIMANDVSATVEWRPKLGYGISFETAGTGEGAEYIYDSANAAAHIVAESLRSRQRNNHVLLVTSDPETDNLTKELRRRGLLVTVARDSAAARGFLGASIFEILLVDYTELDEPLSEMLVSLSRTKRQKAPIVFVLSLKQAKIVVVATERQYSYCP